MKVGLKTTFVDILPLEHVNLCTGTILSCVFLQALSKYCSENIVIRGHTCWGHVTSEMALQPSSAFPVSLLINPFPEIDFLFSPRENALLVFFTYSDFFLNLVSWIVFLDPYMSLFCRNFVLNSLLSFPWVS